MPWSQLTSESLETWAETHLSVQRRSGHELQCICPFHQDGTARQGDLWVNLQKQVYLCYSAACAARGTALQLIQQVEGVSEDDARRVIGNQLPAILEQVRDQLHRKDTVAPQRGATSILSWARVQELRSERYWMDPRPKGRGLEKRTCEFFNLGYDDEYQNALIPYQDYQGPVCFIRRRTIDGASRWLFPRGFDRKNAIFNLQAVTSEEEVVVTEGAVDAMRVWEAGWPNVVATLGAQVSQEQVSLLAHLRIVTFFDRDHAGVQATLQVLERCPRVTRVCRYPAGTSAKDPDELTNEEILGAIDRALPSVEFLRRFGELTTR